MTGLSFERARAAAEHLRALSEVERNNPATLLVLLLAAVASALGEDQARPLWFLSMGASLVLLPLLVRRILPKGNLQTHRLSLAAYPLNAFLLGFVGYLETSKLPAVQIEDLPFLAWLVPLLSLVPAGVYLILQFPTLKKRLNGYGALRKALAEMPDGESLAEVRGLAAQALSGEPIGTAPWAGFRTVPAAPRNLKLFLKLDTERHGEWRAAFAPNYALVLTEEGMELEAVAPGGLRIAAEEPMAGASRMLCLLRWNAHLHEGRITQDSLQKIQTWNARRMTS